MKLLGIIILFIGMVITSIGLFSEKAVSISDVNLTNKRMNIFGWGSLISFLGVGIYMFSDLDK